MRRHLLFLAVVGFVHTAPFSEKVNISLRDKSQANIAVSFTQNTDAVYKSINSMSFETRGLKIVSMRTQLQNLAASSQSNVISLVESNQVKYKSAWINNLLYVQGASAELIQEIANLPEVVEVREQTKVQLDEPKISKSTESTATKVEWGLEQILAPEAWALPGGNNGSGSVIGVIDTGSRVTHEALRNNYRSEYGWFDAVNGREDAYDDNFHGTHVAAIAVSVAPGAQLILCKAFDWAGEGEESSIVSCTEFILCPDAGDLNCTTIPAISSNSWGVRGNYLHWFLAIEDAWHAAEITPVFSIGNHGPRCGFNGSPGKHPNVIGVGATTDQYRLADFSSRGPAVNTPYKPDISAPGENIRSAGVKSDTDYETMSGTSMATPFISGVIALLKSHNPNLIYQEVKDFLNHNANTRLPADGGRCGGIGPWIFPGNGYGWGIVDAKASLGAAINSTLNHILL